MTKVNTNDKIINDIEDKVIENITLNMFHIASNQTNYHILKLLPNNVENIMKEINLTKVPVNKRINELKKYGLLKREKGTGNVYPTYLTDLFKSLIIQTEKHVKTDISEMLPTIIN